MQIFIYIYCPMFVFSRKTLIFIMLYLIFLAQESAGSSCDGITPDILSRHTGKRASEFEIVSKRPVFDLCEVIVRFRNNFIPFYVARNFLIVGVMFSEAKNISKSAISLSRRQFLKNTYLELKDLLERASAITHAPYKGKVTIFFFTDPGCPFCRRSEKPLMEVARKCQAIIKVLFYPVHGKDDAISAVCKNLSYTDYISRKWTSHKESCQRGREIVEASLVVAKRFGIAATPTFLIVNGREAEIISGANIKAVEEKCLELSR